LKIKPGDNNEKLSIENFSDSNSAFSDTDFGFSCYAASVPWSHHCARDEDIRYST